jgi:hypothetical protein
VSDYPDAEDMEWMNAPLGPPARDERVEELRALGPEHLAAKKEQLANLALGEDRTEAIRKCPVFGCGEQMHYMRGIAMCEADHRFAHYKAIGGLLPIGDDHHPSGPMYVAEEQVISMLDIQARLWNALVWYTNDKRKFWNRLLELMETLALASHKGPDGSDRPNQMDTEYGRLREALRRGTP